MAIKIKAVERKLKFSKTDEGEYRYVMLPEMYSALGQEKVIREAALRSGVSQGVMQTCWDAAGEVIKAWATEGHSVALPGLGTMRFGLSAQSVADLEGSKNGGGLPSGGNESDNESGNTSFNTNPEGLPTGGNESEEP